MRLYTRADLDGVTSAVMITQKEPISEVVFVHPKDMQDGLIEVLPGDAISNLPFHPNATLWFDHHNNAEDLPKDMPDVAGKCGVAPSAARLVYEYYNDKQFDGYEVMLHQTDRVDSANLDMEDVIDPQGWVLLSYTLDPRTGLGGMRGYAITIIDAIRSGLTIDQILDLPIVKGRVNRYFFEVELFQQELKKHSKLVNNIILTDFRSLDKTPTGNRFLVFALYPNGNVQIRVFWIKNRTRVMAAVGKSIFDRSCDVHIGDLMAEYGGGGLDGAGTCQFAPDEADEKIVEIFKRLRK